jgi:hypothetical protein
MKFSWCGYEPAGLRVVLSVGHSAREKIPHIFQSLFCETGDYKYFAVRLSPSGRPLNKKSQNETLAEGKKRTSR